MRGLKGTLLSWLIQYILDRELPLAREVMGFLLDFDPGRDIRVSGKKLEVVWYMLPPRHERKRDLARAYMKKEHLLHLRDRYGLQVDDPDEQFRLNDFLGELHNWEENVLLQRALSELEQAKDAIRKLGGFLGFEVVHVGPEFREWASDSASSPEEEPVIIHPSPQVFHLSDIEHQ